MPLDVYSSVGMSCASGASDFYINGVLEGQETDAFTIPTTTSNACLLNWNHTTNRGWSRGMVVICVWDRKLSAAEQAAMHKDRYHFLIPKAPLGYIYVPSATGGYFIPDPRFEMPALFESGRKPNSDAVTIDWSHPLTKGLGQYYLFNENGSNIRDLVDGSVFDIDTGVRGVDATGKYLRFSSTSIPIKPITQTTAFTKLVVMLLDSTANQFNFMSDNSNGSYLWSTPSGGAQIGHNTSFGMLSGDAIPVGAVTSIGETYNSVGTWAKLWQEGEITDSTVSAVAIASTAAQDLGSYGAGFYHDGPMYLALTYNRALSDAEMRSISLNPYQILIPA